MKAEGGRKWAKHLECPTRASTDVENVFHPIYWVVESPFHRSDAEGTEFQTRREGESEGWRAAIGVLGGLPSALTAER
jgi:hypothetical protein